jgi:hypothetical protein
MKAKESRISEKRMVTVDQLVTVSDLNEAKQHIVSEIKQLFDSKTNPQPPTWLKSNDVKRKLQISTGKLFKLRSSGELPYTKIGRVIFYNPNDIENMLQRSKTQND